MRKLFFCLLVGVSCFAQNPLSQDQQRAQQLQQMKQQQQLQQQMAHLQQEMSELASIKVDDIYTIESAFIANNTENAQCKAGETSKVFPNSVVLIKKIMADDGGKIMFLLRNTPNDTDPLGAKQGQIYCIGREEFNLFKGEKIRKVEFGAALMAIPFKFQYNSYVIHPGGSIGGFAGARFNSTKKKERGFNIGAFGGLSSVPQNNDANTPNASDIKVIAAFGLGAGAIYNYERFQIGLVTGWDFYNNGGKKVNSWLSFTVGFAFLKAPDSETSR